MNKALLGTGLALTVVGVALGHETTQSYESEIESNRQNAVVAEAFLAEYDDIFSQLDQERLNTEDELRETLSPIGEACTAIVLGDFNIADQNSKTDEIERIVTEDSCSLSDGVLRDIEDVVSDDLSRLKNLIDLTVPSDAFVSYEQDSAGTQNSGMEYYATNAKKAIDEASSKTFLGALFDYAYTRTIGVKLVDGEIEYTSRESVGVNPLIPAGSLIAFIFGAGMAYRGLTSRDTESQK